MTGTRAVIAAVGVALALGVSACSGGDPEPRVAPPSTSPPTSPSTTPASDTVPPTMPPEARGTDAASAEAFVKFYFDTVNYAQSTGDVNALNHLAARCGGCDAGVQSIERTYDEGGSIKGGEGRAAEFKTGFLDKVGGDWAVVECTVFTRKQLIDRPGESDDVRYPKGSTDVRLILQPSSGAWVVRSLVTR
ncbi:DUF6318 family protein [Nocardioides sp. URHA0032]|uniref:DUF6318 family protein n=1 Tax=Nocardioides sp. URHA0032 TaxID=1380388 RepID=UPI00048DFB86|nr:DUF6318 family protein [Nocardioides sp. URHA0032]